MAKEYTFPDGEPQMVKDDMMTYSPEVTIPVSLPSIGNYSVDELKKELTDFAMKLLRNSADQSDSRPKWRNITIPNKVKAMTLGPSSLSQDPRSDKELLIEALEEKYK